MLKYKNLASEALNCDNSCLWFGEKYLCFVCEMLNSAIFCKNLDWVGIKFLYIVGLPRSKAKVVPKSAWWWIGCISKKLRITNVWCHFS